MDITKVVAVGITATLMSVFLKQYNREFSVIIGLLFTVLIFFVIVPPLEEILGYVKNFFSQTGANAKYLETLLKIVGISFIAQLGRDICIDAGETAIANKIEFFGKIIITLISLPILLSLFELIASVLNF